MLAVLLGVELLGTPSLLEQLQIFSVKTHVGIQDEPSHYLFGFASVL